MEKRPISFLFDRKHSLNFVVLLFVFAILSVLVSAAHVVLTSSGGTSLNFNEDISNLYNISVNVTDLGQSANITQVNITLPASFSFLSNSANTSALTYTFVNTSIVLSWNSSFLINGTSGANLTFFFFNATASTPGAYNITVTSVNASGVFNSNISVTINDTTAPTITIYNIIFNDGNISNADIVHMSPRNQDNIRDGIKINITASEIVNFSVSILSGGFTSTNNNANNTVEPSSCFWNATSTQCAGGTNLSDGTYIINIIMTDVAGNIAVNSTKSIVVDGKSPSITDNSGLSAGYFNSTKLINVTITDANTVNATLFVNGTAVNSSSTSNNTQLTFILLNGNHSYYVAANDLAINRNSTSNVSGIIVDTTIPLVAFTSPTFSTGSNLSQNSLFVNISLTEINLANITYLLYNSSSLVNSTIFTSGTTSINFTNLPNTDYTYQVNATDFAGNKNSTEVRLIRLDTTAPSATLLLSSNNTFNSTTTQNLTANITDNLGIRNATLNIFNSTSLVNQTEIIFTSGNVVQSVVGVVLTLVDGSYKWFYKIFDWSGNSFTTQNNTLTIDTINPSLIITYPTNTTYTSVQTNLNYTASDTNLQTCRYSTNSTVNVTITCGTNATGISSGEGSSTWSVYVNDSAGNTNTSRVTFFVDSIKPAVQFVSPTDANSSYLSRSNIVINATASDTNFANVTIRLFNSTALVNVSNSTGSPIFVNYSSLLDGVYTFNATALDILSNSNTTETRRVTIDTTVPLVDYAAPTQADGANVSANFIFVNVSATELNEANITFRLFNSTGLVNQTIFSTAQRSINFTSLTAGIYFYNVTIIDLASNVNRTGTRNITLNDIIAPTGVLLAPANNTFASNATQNYTVNATDNLGIKNATLNIVNSTGSIINQATTTFVGGVVQSVIGTVVTLVDGAYQWFYSIFDFGGNSVIVGNRTITIDTTIPSIQYGTGTETSGVTYNRTNIVVNATASDTNFANVTIRLFNSAGLVSQTTTITSPNFINATGLADGVYTFNATAVDLAGNINSAATRTITIDTIAPSVSFVSPQNTTYFNLSIPITISSNGNNVSFFNGTANETYTAAVNRTFSEGSKTIFAYAVDLAGNFNTTSVTFFVISAPVVTLNSPADGFASMSSSITLDCSAIDNIQVKNISLYLNGFLNQTNFGTASTLSLSKTFNLPDGTYTWRCAAFDDRNTSSTTATRTFIIDTVKPLVTINSPILDQRFNANNFAINISLSEPGYCEYNVDNGGNITLTNTTSTVFIGTSSPLNDGLHSFRAFCRDSAGNRNDTENVSNFIIDQPSSAGLPTTSSGGGGGGGGGGTKFANIEGEFIGKTISVDATSGFSGTLSEGDRFEFDLNGQKHTLKLEKLVGQTAIIIIKSDPIELEISLGEIKKVDVDSDKTYDLEVSFVSLNDGRAEISVRKISEKVPESAFNNLITGKTLAEASPEELTVYSAIGTLALLIILFIIIIFFLSTRRRPAMPQHQNNIKQNSKLARKSNINRRK